ncbi:hypothetical protein, partial [Candidatus Viridilinea mediisalina]|uniref:hypothetical protein n=1 Tax=Candidatus Viridilinea mediisalina TaxID=2024553 RepID=UPI001055F88C
MPAELLHEHTIRVPRGYVAPVVASAAPSAPQWQQELHELQAWLEHGQPYPSRETLKRSIDMSLTPTHHLRIDILQAQGIIYRNQMNLGL